MVDHSPQYSLAQHIVSVRHDVKYTIPMDPVPRKAHRHRKGRGGYKHPQCEIYDKAAALYIITQRLRQPVLDGCLAATIEFALPRQSGVGEYHCKRPDLDNLCKSALDALLTGGAIHDDGQIAFLTLSKRIVSRETGGSTTIRLWSI